VAPAVMEGFGCATTDGLVLVVILALWAARSSETETDERRRWCWLGWVEFESAMLGGL